MDSGRIKEGKGLSMTEVSNFMHVYIWNVKTREMK